MSKNVLEGHISHVTDLAVCSTAEKIFSSSMDKSVRIWDVLTCQQTEKLNFENTIQCIALSPDNQSIALGFRFGMWSVLNINTKDILFEDKAEHKDSVECMSFSPNGMYLVTGSEDNTVRVWNAAYWTEVAQHLHGHKGCVTGVAFKPDGKYIASCSTDCTVRLWDMNSGNRVGISPTLSAHMKSITFTSCGNNIISGSDHGIVHTWNASLDNMSNSPIFRHTDAVTCVSISHNGLQVASASKDKSIRLWDSHSGNQIGVPFEGHESEVNSVSFGPTGRLLVSSSTDGTMRLWDVATCAQIGRPFYWTGLLAFRLAMTGLG